MTTVTNTRQARPSRMSRTLAAIATVLVALIASFTFAPVAATADVAPTDPCVDEKAYIVRLQADVDKLTAENTQLGDWLYTRNSEYVKVVSLSQRQAVTINGQRSTIANLRAHLSYYRQFERPASSADRKQERIERLQAKVARLEHRLHSR